ncbi:MAG: alpha/beta hydrolase, partial [Saprospiraceae bacterium]|nr:alpha/beta hydrolase [Saprospiraceae bacterium]
YMGKYYDGDDYGSVPLITEYDALRFIFKDYPIHFKLADFKDTTEALKQDRNALSKNLKSMAILSPHESMMNGMGYQALGSKQYNLKPKVFPHTMLTQHPGSGNVHDSHGDYFNAIGDKPHAIEQFKKH